MTVSPIVFYCTIFVSITCCVASGVGITSLSTGESITDSTGLDDVIVSPRNKFQMGFFPRNTSWGRRRYVGIWYTVDTSRVVWVANRDRPVRDNTGVLVLGENGDLSVVDAARVNSYFSTGLIGQHNNVSYKNRSVRLLDNGNAVLIDNPSGRILWQSFDHPTDTFLPGMKMDENLRLTSWKSLNDPASGNFTFQEYQEGANRYYVIFNSGALYWRSRDGSSIFNPNQMPRRVSDLLLNPSNQTVLVDEYSSLMMKASGKLKYYLSYNGSNDNGTKVWDVEWEEPADICSLYKTCGVWGRCRRGNMWPKCECLDGFESVNEEQWNAGNYTSGCKRKNGDMCGSGGSSFTHLVNITLDKSPNLPFAANLSENECKFKCESNCSCQAYSYFRDNEEARGSGSPGGLTGCWMWDAQVFDLQDGGTHDVWVSAGSDQSTQAKASRSKSTQKFGKLIIIVAGIALVFSALLTISYIFIHRKFVTKRRERNQPSMLQAVQPSDTERRLNNLLDIDYSRGDDTEGAGIPFFEFKSILVATDNFSDANKLGQGGFGPVYKGRLPGGLEIAVKRLSSFSGQGVEEFRNEVVVIAKLQHRNLVRILGYCMKGNEKILIYEYMRNKSLDAFIFDRTLCLLLDWAKRFEIILGIARGLLYLHQDSRLRIIHRDLKTSNILLDEDMNPKISDFGLAKIVEGKEMEASTKRVIGTYGYMSPEYAIDGLFSTKSDVFSFGVVMLEIISGRRNTGYYQPQPRQELNLLGHAWSLWKEGNPFGFMDRSLMESCNSTDVLKCINIGLLCVEEDPADRPTMTNVVSWLSSDIITLPNPKEPAFVARKGFSSSSSSTNRRELDTQNTISISMSDGR